MAKIRIFSLANKLGLRTEALIKVLSDMGVEDVSPASPVDPETASAAVELLIEQAEEARRQAQAAAEAQAAQEETRTGADAAAVVEEEWEQEFAPPVHDADLKEGLAELEQYLAELQATTDQEHPEAPEVKPLSELAARPTGERPDSAVDVPPVVTVLGHVDHGKTTLLDALRQTDVVSGESGGITQHIGASEVSVNDDTIVFIDTPGHEAFTGMRARGAQVTDVAVLVVAADDGVMPQTVEAIDHIRAADVPMIVAINKIDLPNADLAAVQQQLLQHEIVPEELGGETIVVPISALKHEGLDELLEMILLVAEVEQLWADPQGDFVAVVVESNIDPSEGPLATILIRSGTISVGDIVVCGASWGRIRRLRDWRGKSVKTMEPGHPVEVVGLSDVVEAGEIVQLADSTKQARSLAEEAQDTERERGLMGQAEVQLRQLQRQFGATQVKELNIVLKSDVWGSAQAVEANLNQLGKQLDEIQIDVVHNAVGEVTESDVLLAAASEAIIMGFRVDTTNAARRAAQDEHVEMRSYDVIYEVLDDIRRAMIGMLDPVYEEQTIGEAEVLQTFESSRLGVIGGCRVTSGRMARGARIEVTRNGDQIFDGELSSLRRFENNVATVEAPQECGIAADEFNGWEPGDTITAYQQVEVERSLSGQAAESSSS